MDNVILTTNPAHPTEVLGRFDRTSPRQLEAAVEAARGAQPAWANRAADRSLGLGRWASAIENDAVALANLIAREVGKPIGEARAEVARTAAIIRFHAQVAFDPTGEVFPSPDGLAELTSERVPLGVVLAVTPWNFPMAIPAWKIAPALAYGNSVLFKPASAAAATGHRLLELAASHLPPGVFQVVTPPSRLVEQLASDERIAGVSFTGSAEVGRRLVLRVVRRGGAVQAEMGGQNPSIVLADADLALAATSIAGAAMGYAGQKCTATRRVIVMEAVSDELTSRLVELVRAQPIGDPLDDVTVVGPLIDREARASVDAAVQAVLGRGAKLLTGAATANRDGWFYVPTLIAVDDSADPFVREETFGPAVAIQTVRDQHEALSVANSTRYGLSGAVYGRRLDRAREIARGLNVGMVRVNAPTTGVDFYAPFGGEKASSFGPREQGRAAREFYTRSRTLTVSSGYGSE